MTSNKKVKYEDIFTFEPANEVINIVNNVI